MLRNQKIILLLAFNVLSSFADSFFYLILLSFVTETLALRDLIPLVSLSETLPYFLAVFIGTFADRTRQKRRSLIFSSLARLCIYGLITLLAATSSLFPFVLFACLLNIISDMFGKLAGNLLLPAIKLLVPQPALEQLQGTNAALGQIATIAGTLVGGLLYARWPLATLVFINVVIFTLTLLVSLVIVRKLQPIFVLLEETPPDAALHFMTEVRKVIRMGLHNAKLRSNLLLVAVMNGLLALTLPFVAMTHTGTEIALLLSTLQIVQVVCLICGNLQAGTLLKSVRLSGLTGLFFLCYLLFIGSLYFENSGTAGLFVGCFALVLGVITPKFMSLIITMVDAAHLGGFTGAVNTLVMLTPCLNTLILQVINALDSVHVVLFVYAVIACGGLRYAARLTMRERRLTDNSHVSN